MSDIIDFLKANVPRDDIPKIEAELKKEFVFTKKKGKEMKIKNKRKKNQYLSRKEKKELGFFNLPRHSLLYTDHIQLNHMWNDYMHQILELDEVPDIYSKNWESFTQSLYKADFHGSVIKVIRSKCPSYVDKVGICVLDTKNTFKIISENNIITTIPKKECVFEIHVKSLRFKIFGKQLCVRPAERSTKKVKAQQHPDL